MTVSDTTASVYLPPGGEKGSYAEAEGTGADYTLKTRPWLCKTTPWSQIVNHTYKGGGTNEDPYIVTWLPNGPDGFVDVENPMRYGFWYKWGITMMGE